MKKILTILALLTFSVTMFAQDPTGPNWTPVRKKSNFKDSTYFQKGATIVGALGFDNGATIVNTDADNLDITEDSVNIVGNLSYSGTLTGNVTVGIFNVLDYGAVSGDGNEDQTAIQVAIDSANAWALSVSYPRQGGTVYVPAGDYDQTAPIVLKSYVTLRCEEGAVFSLPDSYADNIFESLDKELFYCNVDGGRWYCPTETPTFLKISSDHVTDAEVYKNVFKNIFLGLINIVFDLEVTNDGWINANSFETIYAEGATEFLKMTESVGSLGIDGNLFINCTHQTTANTTYSLHNISGSWNLFSNYMVWDMPTVCPAAVAVELAATSYYNIIIGGDLENNSTDAGTDNLIISNGNILTDLDYLSIIAGDTDVEKLIVGGVVGPGTLAVPAGSVGIKIGKIPLHDRTTEIRTARILSRNMSSDMNGSQLILQTHNGTNYNDVIGMDYNKGVFYPPVRAIINAATGITVANLGRIIYFNEGANRDITKDPQIDTLNVRDGQMVTIINRHASTTLTLDNGNGLALAGGAQFIMGTNDVITFIYVKPRNIWIEESRSNN